jgi:hypothetical protein
MVKFMTQLFTVSDILWVIYPAVKAEKENKESNDDLFVRLLFKPNFAKGDKQVKIIYIVIPRGYMLFLPQLLP